MSPAGMKGFGLAIAFLVLLGGLAVLRGFRFERIPNAATTTLADLRTMPLVQQRGANGSDTNGQPPLKLATPALGDPRSHSFNLADRQSATALHVRIDAKATGLVSGKNAWDQGRVLVEWRSPDSSVSREVDSVCYLQGNEVTDGLSMVLRPSLPPSLPVLRIEHLGKAGELEITRLELTPVRERLAWRYGRWLVFGAWCALVYGFLSWSTTAAPWKKSLASLVWVGVCVVFVFPGPWKTLHPIGIDYYLGKVVVMASAPQPERDRTAPTTSAHASSPSQKSLPLAPVVSPPVLSQTVSASPQKHIQVADGWILKAKQMFVNERPLLHAFLLFVPTFLFASLVGIRAACVLGGGIAIAIELAQAAFGFGFDVRDIGDLLSDVAGIALAIWLHLVLRRWLELRKLRHG